jgi:phosphohistidine phosphatase
VPRVRDIDPRVVAAVKLYLIHHAEAKPEEEDPNRPLTEKGWADARRVAAHVVGRGVIHVQRIIHSGRLRARQTAEAWAEHLSPVEIISADGLEPVADPATWANRLQQSTEDMMLVGHLPYLERLVSRLLVGDPARRVVEFRNAGAVCLERGEDGRWVVRWSLMPEVV